MKRVSKNCDCVGWLAAACTWLCSRMLLLPPKLMMLLPLRPGPTLPGVDEEDAAAAAAASNSGFDVIVMSRPPLDEPGCDEALSRLEETPPLLPPPDTPFPLLLPTPLPNTLSIAFCREEATG